MERGPRNVPEDFNSLPLSAAVPIDEEISYSPLCSDSEEVKPKHELFHTNINECKEGVVNNFNGLDFASSQSLTKSPNLWDEDLSDTDLFSDYFNESPLNGIDSNKRMNSTAVDHSTQTVQTCGPWLAQPERHYNYEIINTECQLHKLISPGNESLKEDLVVSDGTSYCFTQERSSTLVESLHAKKEPVVSFHSPQSVVLEHLRNCLTHAGGRNGSHSDVLHSLNIKQERSLTESVTPSQNLNPHSRKMAPKRLLGSRSKPSNAGLRQTDIGVFFGLKPLKEKEIEVKEKQPNKTTQAATSELNSEVHSSKRKPRQRKRKATSSIGDSTEQEAVDGSNNNEALTPKEKGIQPRRRGWCKGGSAKEPENGDASAARRCPFYKNIPGTGFVVDAFQYGAVEGCTAYFLTHFHSDHYGGLKKSFRLPIYCNKLPCSHWKTFAATTAFETLTSNPRTLVVCGTYSIGKEKVFLAIADVLGCKVCVSRDKYNIMCCLESERIKELITMDWDATQLHVLPMMQVSYKNAETEERVIEIMNISNPDSVQLDDFKSNQLLSLINNLQLFIRAQIPVTRKVFQSYTSEVVLDPETAHPKLVISPDGISATFSDEWQELPDSPVRFDTTLNVISTEGFSEGRHYWEVDVGGKTYWELGVTYPSISRKGREEDCWLGRSGASWCVEYFNGEYTAWHDGQSYPLPINKVFKRIGVYVSYPAGVISFHGADSMMQLFTFCAGTFTDILHPAVKISSSTHTWAPHSVVENKH
ncbi:UNVERIFIED_CONTAM: hypothetical protein FKN15_045785 [Acipenser sinensis]